MKAYCVYDKDFIPPYVEVVFAETRAKAIYTAVKHTDFAIDWCEYTDMRARRRPALDKYYRGRPVMEWDDDADRLAMVRDGGFHCDDDSFDPDECTRCVGKDYCSKYEEEREEERNEQKSQ